MILDINSDIFKSQKKNTEVVRGNPETLTTPFEASELTFRQRPWNGALFDKENAPKFDEKQMEYLCYSPEICPKTQKFHWQWYCYFKNPKMLKSAVKYFQKTWSPLATVGGRKKGSYKVQGSPEQNRIYCGAENYTCEKTQKFKKKNEKFVEFGKLPKQGIRKDLKELTDQIRDREITCDEIKTEMPNYWHQYGRTLQDCEDLANRKRFRDFKTNCKWIFGPKGVGKTHYWKKDFNPETDYIYNPDDNGFWCGYRGEQRVIINEFRGNIPFRILLELCDDCPYFVKGNKGGNPLPFVSKEIIITSCSPPWELYKNLSEDDKIDQILDRVDIIELTGESKRDNERLDKNKKMMEQWKKKQI